MSPSAVAVAERRIARATTKLAAESIGDLRDEGGWEGRRLVALAALRGLALVEHFEPRVEPRPDPGPIARATVIEIFKTT